MALQILSWEIEFNRISNAQLFHDGLTNLKQKCITQLFNDGRTNFTWETEFNRISLHNSFMMALQI